MGKTRLTEEKRDAILRYMADRYDARHENAPAKKLYARVVAEVNDAIRKKYPESDMEILRKYNAVHKDRCIRFSELSTGRVFAFEIPYGDNKALDLLNDLPRYKGCQSQDVFPAADAFVELFDKWTKARDAEKEDRDTTMSEYRAFVRSCKTIEDCEEIVAFTPEFRERLGAPSNALVAVNPEVISRIREDFAEAA